MTSLVGFIQLYKTYPEFWYFLEVVFKVLTDWSKERGEKDDHYIKNVTLPGDEFRNISSFTGFSS